MGVYIFNKVQSRDDAGKRRDHLRKSDEEIIRIEDGIPAIISKKTFFQAQEKFKANKKKRGKASAKRTYLLSGLIFCGECKNTFHGNSRWCGRRVTKYTTYRCSLKSKSKHSCSNKEVSADFIESFVLKEIKRLILSPKKLKMLEKSLKTYSNDLEDNLECKVRNLKEAISQIDVKIERLIQAIKEGISMPSIKNEIEVLENKKGELEYELHCIRYKDDKLDIGLVKDALKRLGKSIKNNDMKQCKKLLPLFIERM